MNTYRIKPVEWEQRPSFIIDNYSADVLIGNMSVYKLNESWACDWEFFDGRVGDGVPNLASKEEAMSRAEAEYLRHLVTALEEVAQ